MPSSIKKTPPVKPMLKVHGAPTKAKHAVRFNIPTKSAPVAPVPPAAPVVNNSNPADVTLHQKKQRNKEDQEAFDNLFKAAKVLFPSDADCYIDPKDNCIHIRIKTPDDLRKLKILIRDHGDKISNVEEIKTKIAALEQKFKAPANQTNINVAHPAATTTNPAPTTKASQTLVLQGNRCMMENGKSFQITSLDSVNKFETELKNNGDKIKNKSEATLWIADVKANIQANGTYVQAKSPQVKQKHAAPTPAHFAKASGAGASLTDSAPKKVHLMSGRNFVGRTGGDHKTGHTPGKAADTTVKVRTPRSN